jgi:hypothetical protein
VPDDKDKESVDDLTLYTLGQERRAAPRVGGDPIPVLLCEGDPPGGEPFRGVVIDRSLGGLGLSLDRPLEKGALLSLRVADAPPTTPWVRIEVRNCQPAGTFWEVGCQFYQTPISDVLQLFG